MNPSPSSVIFARGIIARLAVWSTLRIAVQESWGGAGAAEKRTWLASVIVDAFEEQIPPPDDQYIEELLLQVMADEFDAVLEDGSAEGVAVDIVRMWDETRLGKQDVVSKYEGLAEKLKGKKAVVQEAPSNNDDEWEDDADGSEDESGEDSEDEVPQLLDHSRSRPRPEPEVDEDGFTVVKGKGKNRQ